MAVWNPIKPMKAHDMIETKHARVAHLEAQHVAKITIALLAKPLRVQRRETPVLAFAEERVRRRADGRAGCKSIACTPMIVTGRVNTEREVEVELNAVRATIFRQRGDLFVGKPLNVEMV